MKVNSAVSCDNAHRIHDSRPQVPRKFQTSLLLLIVVWFVASSPVEADELEVVITGVEEPVLSNVQAFVAPFRFSGTGRLSQRRLRQLRAAAEADARVALRPFGYYHPQITAKVHAKGDRIWQLEVKIDPGPPVMVVDASVAVSGPGSGLRELKAWRDNWPLRAGRVLLQPTWDVEKERALEIAADNGYLLANFQRHSMQVDLERNEARLDLALETGEQAVMGEVRFNQDIVRPYIMDNLPRFRSGDPYSAWIMERFRIDLWQLGYFDNIEIVEDRHLDRSPPRVDLDIRLEPRKPNTYQGTIGVGSDTGARVLFSWNRHLVSDRGDTFSLSTGWQDHNDEYFVRAGYRIPRNVRTRQSWIAEALFKRENENLKVSDSLNDEVLYDLGNVDVSDYSVRLGRLRVRDRQKGYRQWFNTWYVQYLHERVDFRPTLDAPPEITNVSVDDNPGLAPQFSEASNNLSPGIEFEMPFVRGQGFETEGQHYRAWAFVSNEAWGSDRDFTQAYVSGRWNVRLGERWKILARGEVGYSDADVNTVETIIDDSLVRLSITELPNLYRFKAGGSSSVRGYAFERLSDNNIGSNNIITASLEAEYRILDNWSLAAFFDTGNAFNDWGDFDLKSGVGLGVRWYTIAGAMRVDVAKALDLPDQPWRIHFTIGASLL